MAWETREGGRKLSFTDREQAALQKPLNQIAACAICKEIDAKSDMLRLSARLGTSSQPRTRVLCYLCQPCFDRFCNAVGVDALEYLSGHAEGGKRWND